MRMSCGQLLSPYWSRVDSLVWLVLLFLLTGEATSFNREDPLFIQMHVRDSQTTNEWGPCPLFYPAVYVIQTSPLGLKEKIYWKPRLV